MPCANPETSVLQDAGQGDSGSRRDTYSPIQTSPNCPDPSFLTSLRDCRGISHSSWAQGFWRARLTQGCVSLWHKPSPFSALGKKRWDWSQTGLILMGAISLPAVSLPPIARPTPPPPVVHTPHTRSSLHSFCTKQGMLSLSCCL